MLETLKQVVVLQGGKEALEVYQDALLEIERLKEEREEIWEGARHCKGDANYTYADLEDWEAWRK